MSDGLLRWAINTATILWVGHASHKEGYAQGQRDLVMLANTEEIRRLQEEVERLKRNQR